MNHNTEVRKLSCQLPAGRLVIVKSPEAMAEIAALCQQFGETYRMGGLPATLGRCIQKGLRPKRENCTDAQRMAL